jgi:hypothetical protein
MPPKTLSVVPSGEQLAHYSAVDPTLPVRILQAREFELQWEFQYAALSATYGILALLSVVGGYIYLVIHGSPQAAAGLLAAGVLSLIGGFVRSRLRQ